MGEVLVLVDHVEGEIKKSTFELLTAARTLGEPSAVIVGGPGTATKLADGLREYGAEKVYVAETDSTEFLSPQVDVLAALVGRLDPAAVLIASSADGKEVAGRLAVRTGSGWLNDVVALDTQGTTHSVFGGAWTAQATANTAHPVITLRQGAVEAVAAAGAGTEESVDVPPSGRSATVVSREPVTTGERPDLGEASVVVSGGRGVGSAEQFAVVEALADSLGAAVGASRAAVDSGFVPNDYQVGQTGKIVAPELYVAVGISGAIQHLAGMKDSKVIVAINKDAEAPIFQIADYGLVADLFQAVPELTDKLG